MATEVKLPELGENLTGGEVSDVKVKPGDAVTQGQTLLEVEAEKSTVEVPSPVTGKIREVLVKKGDAIAVGQTLCLIEETADGGKQEKPVEETADGDKKDIPAKTSATRPVAPMPDTGEPKASSG